MALPQGEIPAESISKWTGLVRSIDPFAIAPGAMAVADNLVVPGPSLLQPRRGYRTLTTSSSWASLGVFGDFLMGLTTGAALSSVKPAVGTFTSIPSAASDLTLYPATLSAYGPGSPTTCKARFFQANGNLYQSTNFGLARLCNAYSTWIPAGFPQPPCPQINASALGFGTATNKFLANNYQVAYRATFRYTDANGNVHRSAPGQKYLINNTSGGAGYTFSYYDLSSMVPNGTILELWRTPSIAIPSDNSDATGEEFFKVAEVPIPYGGGTVTVGAAGNYAFGYLTQETQNLPADPVVITDGTPNTPFLVEPLYTNPTTGLVNGLGIANANTAPPAAADVFTFRDRTYFANTEEVQRLELQIIGTGTGSATNPGGIQAGDTFFVNGQGFCWVNSLSPSPPTGYYPVTLWQTGATEDKGSIAQNLTWSANYAALAINTMFNAFGDVLGFTLSGHVPQSLENQVWATTATVDGLGGYVVLTSMVPGSPAITVTAGVGAGRGWNGQLTTNNVSDSNRQPANLMQSQPNDPESVPPAFTNVVGHAQLPILRGVPLRDSCFIFKGGVDGLWKFTDDGTGTLTISPLDQTVHLIAPETAVALDNAVFCLTDKGVLRITDGGAPENLSNDRIQQDLARLIQYVGTDTLARLAFGVAYESSKTYVLCLPESPNAAACTLQYVYNVQTDAWTKWNLPYLACGAVSPVDTLAFGLTPAYATLPGTLWLERKALDDSDYQDPGFTVTVPSSGTASSLVFTGNQVGSYPAVGVAQAFAPGDLVQYSSAGKGYLARVLTATYASGPNQTTVTFDQSIPWVASETFALLKGVQWAAELLPLVAGESLYEKQWQNVYLYFRRSTGVTYNLSYSTEKQPVPVTYPLSGPTQYGWYYSPTAGWGTQAWGGPTNNIILKLALDQATARSAELTLRIAGGDALAGWQLSSLRIPYDPATLRVVR